jgi:predicted phosphodiesterase
VAGLRDDITTAAADSTAARRNMLGRIADLLDRNGISVDDVGAVRRVSLYQSVTKDADGEPAVHDLTAVQLSPKWADGPAWPPVQPAPPIRVTAGKGSRTAAVTSTAVVLPDMQVGYYRGADGEMVATHDERALAVALAVLKDARPSLVVLVGDNLDLPEMGKYRTTPAYRQTMQAAIDRAAGIAAEVRAAAGPTARIVWLAGNHEERLPRYILDNAAAAFGLRQGNTPEGWPVMSVPHLCRLDDSAVEYLAGYPASQVWITPTLRVIHGDRVNSGGSTAHKYLNAGDPTSVIYGHIHRIEAAYRTRVTHDGPRTVLAASPGCLARIDGAVPSVKGGVDVDGRPLVRFEDWQQGLAVVPFDPVSGRFTYEQVPILDGCAWWRGKVYAA